MSEENTFGDQTKTSTEGAVENKDVLFEIGERKYDLDAVQKKILSADEHIKRIEAENAELREKINKATTLDAVMQAMKERGEATNQQTTVPNADDLVSLVKRTLSEQSQEERRANNLMTADKLMKERFGDKAKEVLEKKAKELGIGLQTATDVAAHSPAAFMQWFQSTPAEPVHSTNQGTNLGNPDATSGPEEGTYKWYAAMRKSDPARYNSPSVQRKMIEDAERLGKEAFFK